jgi:hypothetical protein
MTMTMTAPVNVVDVVPMNTDRGERGVVVFSWS